MTELAKINFYEIDRCGYYDPDNNVPRFCSLPALMPDVAAWVRHNNKPLSDTRTFSVPDNSDLLQVYCHNIRCSSTTQDYLVTTWNETPSIDGQTASVSAHEPVGHAKVYLNEVKANTIPGFPTYFWIIPSRNVLATIRFDHPQNGQAGLCLYLRSFLQKCSSHVQIDPAWDRIEEIRVMGYCEHPGVQPQPLRPQFSTRLLRKPGAHRLIRQKRQQIRKVIRKNRIRTRDQNDVGLWQKMLRGIGMSAPPVARNDVKVKWELEFTPTEEQLNQIIESWEKQHELQWDDVGFVMTGEPEPLWLSHIFVKMELQIDVRRPNPAIIADDTLLSALQTNRSRLLDLVAEKQ